MSTAETNTNLRAVADFLARFAPFDQMAMEDLELLAGRCRLAFYGEGEAILTPESGTVNHLYIVKKGQVRGERPGSTDERNRIFLLGPGECFPLGALLGERPTRTIHRAVTDTFCFELPREDFVILFERSEPFRDFFIRGVSGLLERVTRKVHADAAESLGGQAVLNAPLSKLLGREPVTCTPQTSISNAARVMHREKVGSIVICDPNRRPLGIFTLHDVLAVAAQAKVDLEQPIATVMTPDPKSLPPQAFAFEAALLMATHRFGHVCVVEHGRLLGVVSERDLFALQRVSLVHLTRAISAATSIGALRQTRPQIHQLIDGMLAHGVLPEQVMQVITLLNDYTVRRAIELSLAEMGKPGVPFNWIAFGSEGRREQTLHTDQDNGMLLRLPAGMGAEEARQRALPLALHINRALDSLGLPLCKGNIMASNPELCLSVQEWRDRFATIIASTTPENLLKSSIFFDYRPVWGVPDEAVALYAGVAQAAAGNSIFQRMLAETALRNRPPLGLIRDFVVDHDEADTIDLKLHGIGPFVDAARVLALANGLTVSGTPERLRELAARNVLDARDVESWLQSFSLLQLFRMRNHQAQHAAGKPLSNRIDPEALTPMDRRSLKEAFREGRRLQRRLELDYQL